MITTLILAVAVCFMAVAIIFVKNLMNMQLVSKPFYYTMLIMLMFVVGILIAAHQGSSVKIAFASLVIFLLVVHFINVVVNGHSDQSILFWF